MHDAQKSIDAADVAFGSRPRAAHVAVLLDGGIATHVLPKSGSIVLGRSVDCDIVIDHASVSRRHARIDVGPPLRVEDLGSSNGTRVGGVAIEAKKACAIVTGTLLELGAALVIVQGEDEHRPVRAAPRPEDDDVPWADDSPFARLMPLFDLVASSAISVLLIGDSGVGKDMAAERIHRRSPRVSSPLVRVSCADRVEADVGRDLFGGEDPGALELASGGTLVLEEPAALSVTLQARLARVLEHRRVEARGTDGAQSGRSLDLRVLSTSQADLERLAQSGAFRQDLYALLSGITIALPPLSERAMDVPLLARVFVREACRKLAKLELGVGSDALSVLASHAWPGNVRELRAVMERAALLARGPMIGAEHVSLHRYGPASIPPPAPSAVGESSSEGPTPKAPEVGVEVDERQRLVDALHLAAGSRTRAAELLGVSRRTLLRRLDRYKLVQPRKPTR